MGSNYDTVLGVWQGTRNNLSLVWCNDDSNGTIQSALTTPILNVGSTYYIQVGQYYGPISTSTLDNAQKEPYLGDSSKAADKNPAQSLQSLDSKSLDNLQSQLLGVLPPEGTGQDLSDPGG